MENLIDEMKETATIILGSVAIVVLLVVMIFAPIMGFSMAWERQYCETQKKLSTGYEFQWETFGGCMVETPNGFWVHAPDYLVVETTDGDDAHGR